MTDDYKNDNVERVLWAYWSGDKQGVRWYNWDRCSMQLPGRNIPSLAIKKGQRDKKRVYLVELSGAETFWLDRVGPGVYKDWPE